MHRLNKKRDNDGDEYNFENDEHIRSVINFIFEDNDDTIEPSSEFDGNVTDGSDRFSVVSEHRQGTKMDDLHYQPRAQGRGQKRQQRKKNPPYVIIPGARPILGRGNQQDSITPKKIYSFCNYCRPLQMAKGWMPRRWITHRTVTEDRKIVCPALRVKVYNEYLASLPPRFQRAPSAQVLQYNCNSNAPSLPRREIQQRGASSTYEPIDKLQFYHVRVPNNQENAVSNEGLGEWPSDLENINDLLLFNSGRNLYENFIISDPLIGGPQVKNNENVDVSNIGAAPLSITERSSLARTSNQNYFYSPTIGEVPELDVPLDLPDLPGVADNVRYSEIEALADSIAPSATVSKPPDFPRIVPNVEIEIIDVAELPPVTNDSDADVYIPPDVILMPPPPPLPQVKVENPKIIEQAEQITPKVVVEKMEPIDRLIDNGNNNLLLQMRSNLMESIRNAGGTKKLRPVQGNKGKKKQVSPPSMDLMADLHSKLQMRRKGISGTKAQQNASFSGDSTFNKISAMIPSPREKNEESTGSESEDWQ